MSNITENRINVTLSTADITSINTSIAAIAGKLPNISLDENQRSQMLSMDVDNKIFAEDCMNEVTISGAGIIPAFINPAFLQNDLALYEQLDAIEASIENVLQKVKDVKRLAADEAMTVSNAIYKTFEMANLAGVLGAKQAYDKLSARYAKRNPNPKIDTLP